MNRSPQVSSHPDGAARDSGAATPGACHDTPAFASTTDMFRPVARDDISEGQMGWLLSTIETEIIPRLLRVHGAEVAVEPAAREPVRPRDGAASALAQLVLANQAGAPAAFVEGLRTDGVSLEVIYLQVMAPAARHLGDLWDADLCDFTQVTIGLWRLQQLMYELSPAFQNNASPAAGLRQAMLVPVPGSLHTLGLLMVAEFFRRDGWRVWGEPAASEADLVNAVKATHFDMVGFSVGAVAHITSLKRVIDAIRKASLNPAIKVMVGGPVFLVSPKLMAEVGADATAPDAACAVETASKLVPCRLGNTEQA